MIKTKHITEIYLAALVILLITVQLKAGDIEIVNQSTGVTECAGEKVVLQVDAISKSQKPLRFQWFFDIKMMPGASSAVLDLGLLKHSQSGDYSCKISYSDNSEITWTKPIPVYALTTTSISSEPMDTTIRYNPENGSVRLEFKAHLNGISDNEIQKNTLNALVQWYEITPNGNVKLTDNEVYTGCMTNLLSLKIFSIKDTSYYFAEIVGKCGTATTRTARVIVDIPDLTWLTQPENLQSCQNTTGFISAEARTSTGYPISYQWYKNGHPLKDTGTIHGSNSTKLFFDPLTQENGGNYKLEAKLNELNYKIISNSALVTLNPLPKIFSQDIEYLSDSSHHSVPLFYADLTTFKTKDSEIVKLYRDNYVFSNLTGHDFNENYRNYNLGYGIFDQEDDYSGLYWFTITNSCGTISSDTFDIDVNHLQWVQQPLNRTVCEGEQAMFQGIGEAKTHKSISYMWFREDGTQLVNTSNISGTDAPVLTFKKAGKSDEGNYYLKISVGIKSHMLTSKLFTLTVNTKPVFKVKPDNKIVELGSDNSVFYMELEESSDSAFVTLYSYDFERNIWSVLYNETQVSALNLVKSNINYSDSAMYYCRVRNKCGITYSDTVKVSVIAGNVISSVSNSELKDELELFPNPAGKTVSLNLFLKQDSQISGYLINPITGDKLEILDCEGFIGKNNYNIDLSSYGLSTGMYIVQINDGCKIITEKLMILK